MMSAGVPAGASQPAEKVSASSGKPLSTMVGTSGKSLLRAWVVTASADLALLDQRQQRRRGPEIHLDAAAEDIGDGLRTALVGDAGNVGTGDRLERLAQDLRQGA